jgi:cytochrome c oxidase subunit IV
LFLSNLKNKSTKKQIMSDHTLVSPEITFAHEPVSGTKKIWKVFWLLSVITVIELTLGLGLAQRWYGQPEDHVWGILFVKGAICILSLAKAFYIVSVFMHLGDEIRNLIMTIVVPLCLFIWFLAAFLIDGNSWKILRNRYNQTDKPKTEQVVPAQQKGSKD